MQSPARPHRLLRHGECRDASCADRDGPGAPGPSSGRFVVELVGPPGAGKTTLARAAAMALEQRGVPVTLALSVRPAEARRRRLPGASTLLRLMKIGALVGASRNEPTAKALLELMPLRGRLASLRRRRYIAALARARTGGLSLQDQGYLCALAGLAADSGRIDEAVLARALEAVPLPDLAVRVEVPPDVAAARLRQRLSVQGAAERMLERAPDDNARLVEAFALIDTLLARRGTAILRVSGRDVIGLQTAVDAVVAAVLERSASVREAAVAQ
jgi:thymidylate kinase